MPIHVFWCFGILTKHIFGIKVKNNNIYMFHVYWTYVHMQHASKCLSIMFLYLYKFIEKSYFPLKVWFLENTVFGF